MLSRYRSVSVVSLPGSYNNPIQRFEEAAEHRAWVLEQRAPELGPGSLGTALRLWDGPLAGIAHQEGQFLALAEGPAAEEATQPPQELAEGLSLDLEFLLGLAEITRGVLYDAYGSESEFSVVPIILEPRLGAGRPQPQQPNAAALPQPPSIQPPTNHEAQPELMPPGCGIRCGGGGEGAGGGGGWWSVAEAVATPLTWEEVSASLGVAPGLAAEMPPPQRFYDQQAFLSHMLQKHISKLEGGEQVQAAGTAEAPAPPPAAPTDPWVTDSAATAAAAAGAGAGTAPSRLPSHAYPCGAEDGAELILRRRQQRQQRASMTAAAALAAAVRELSAAVVFPAALQVVLGSEALGWNPIPLLWVGRSRRNGAVIGLLTAVVWT